MIVPAHWAEGRIQQKVDGRQITVRRFGWSDDSPIAAQAHADQRTQEAFARIAAGDGQLRRREKKEAYDGVDGLPIREQIVQRQGDAVVTRNSYGALCLNTPDTLFVDIDFEAPAADGFASAVLGAMAAAMVAGGLVAWVGRSWIVGVATLLAVFVVVYRLSARRQRGVVMSAAATALVQREQQARMRIERFVEAHPEWHLRLYRTPAGFRALAMHRTFSPGEAATGECFEALGADTVFARMCRSQNCFRARLTPKPWRIGYREALRPRPGVWPIAPDRLAERERWVAGYAQASQGHAACQFVAALGTGAVHPSAEAVCQLHDELSGANSGLPIA